MKFTLEERGYTKATWKNGKKKVTGHWIYNWAADSFTIILNSKDPITNRERIINTYNDVPEWGNWKRINE